MLQTGEIAASAEAEVRHCRRRPAQKKIKFYKELRCKKYREEQNTVRLLREQIKADSLFALFQSHITPG